MKKNEIKVGSHYVAKVSNKLTTVRVDAIREVSRYAGQGFGGANYKDSTVYDVTNLKTGRKTTFRSAAKFRYPTKPDTRSPLRTEMEQRHAQAEAGHTDESDEAERQAEERSSVDDANDSYDSDDTLSPCSNDAAQIAESSERHDED